MKNIRIPSMFKQQSLLYYFMLLVTSMSIFTVSCQKDIAFLPNASKIKKSEAIPVVSLNEAKDFLTRTKVNSLAGSAIKLNPLWTDAYLDTALSGKKYLITPLVGSGFKVNHKAAEARLMFYKDSMNVVKSLIFNFYPTPEYRQRKHEMLEMEDFTGCIMFYELDGRLKKAIYCQNGSVVGYGRESREASPRSMYEIYVEFDCEGCGWWITVYDEVGSSGGGDNTGTGYDPWAGGTGGGGAGGSSGSGSGGSGGGGGGSPSGCPTCMPEDGPTIPVLALQLVNMQIITSEEKEYLVANEPDQIQQLYTFLTEQAEVAKAKELIALHVKLLIQDPVYAQANANAPKLGTTEWYNALKMKIQSNTLSPDNGLDLDMSFPNRGKPIETMLARTFAKALAIRVDSYFDQAVNHTNNMNPANLEGFSDLIKNEGGNALPEIDNRKVAILSYNILARDLSNLPTEVTLFNNQTQNQNPTTLATGPIGAFEVPVVKRSLFDQNSSRCKNCITITGVSQPGTGLKHITMSFSIVLIEGQ